MESDLS